MTDVKSIKVDEQILYCHYCNHKNNFELSDDKIWKKVETVDSEDFYFKMTCEWCVGITQLLFIVRKPKQTKHQKGDMEDIIVTPKNWELFLKEKKNGGGIKDEDIETVGAAIRCLEEELKHLKRIVMRRYYQEESRKNTDKP